MIKHYSKLSLFTFFMFIFSLSAASFEKLCISDLKDGWGNGDNPIIKGQAVDWVNGDFGDVSYWDIRLPLAIIENKNSIAYKELRRVFNGIVKYENGKANSFLGVTYSKSFQTYKVCLFDVDFNEGYYGENAFIESLDASKIEVSSVKDSIQTFKWYMDKDKEYWEQYYREKYDVRNRLHREAVQEYKDLEERQKDY